MSKINSYEKVYSAKDFHDWLLTRSIEGAAVGEKVVPTRVVEDRQSLAIEVIIGAFQKWMEDRVD